MRRRLSGEASRGASRGTNSGVSSGVNRRTDRGMSREASKGACGWAKQGGVQVCEQEGTNKLAWEQGG